MGALKFSIKVLMAALLLGPLMLLVRLVALCFTFGGAIAVAYLILLAGKH
jgi:hypothetical protein